MAGLFGGGWDSAASSLFFSESDVDRLLAAGEPALSVEALLAADSIIQDVQAQAPRLIDFLVQPAPLARLLFYLTLPQPEAETDAAYRCARLRAVACGGGC